MPTSCPSRNSSAPATMPESWLYEPDVVEAIDKAANMLADAFVAHAPAMNARMIPADHLDAITEGLVQVIAEVIQVWIDAGSEREVTMENEGLFRAIRDELAGWST